MERVVNVIQFNIQAHLMSFVYSFYPTLDHIPSSFYPFFSPQQQHLHPNTIIVSNLQSFPDSAQKNEYLEQTLQTQATSLNHLSPPEPKRPLKFDKKPLKKENGRKKDQNFGWRNQNKDRNILSAILKSYIQFTLNSQPMIKVIENLSKKLALENGVSTFYRFIAETFPSKKSYVGIKHMKEVLALEGTAKELVGILGVTLKYYLKNVYPLTVCQGIKQKKKVKLSLLKKVRNILSMLFQ